MLPSVLRVGRCGFLPAEGRRLEQLEAAARFEAVNLLDVELAHEPDGAGSEHLARHHDREARGIRDDEARRDQLRPRREPRIDVRAVEREILAAGLVIGGVEPGSDVALDGGARRVLAEAGVEARDAGEIAYVFHERLDTRFERGALAVGPAGEL